MNSLNENILLGSAQQITTRLEELGAVSDDYKCISRFYGTSAHQQAGELLMYWMRKVGLEVFKDDIGNIRGILRSNSVNAKNFVIGSHYDTVFDAGKYDGSLGILIGLEIAEKLINEKIDLPFHLNVIAFADEEGSRFNTAYLGSSVIANCFDKKWLDRKDDNGSLLSEVIKNCGGDPLKLSDHSISKERLLGYFEVHIEQGPILCEQDLPVCLVSGIASQTRVNVQWIGECGHAGTYPMGMRNDALCAFSEFNMEVERIGQHYKENLVATVGKINLEPNVSNVIPGIVNHSLDLRSIDDFFLKSIQKKLKRKATIIANRRGVEMKWNTMQTNASVVCDQGFNSTLKDTIQKLGIKQVMEIPSGAGHDAVMMSKVTPVSMLFVRCKDGKSHTPLEHVDVKDIEVAFCVGYNSICKLIEKYSV